MTGLEAPVRPAGRTGNPYVDSAAVAARTGAVHLGPGQPDGEPAADLVDAAVAALRSGGGAYAPGPGCLALREEVAAAAGRPVDPETEVTITCGCTEALSASMLAFLRPGDEVLAFEPFYDSYPRMVALAGATLVPVPLAGGRGRSWRVDVPAMERAVTPRTRMLLVNSPHNPTGHVLDDTELAALADLARRHDLLVVADEVYDELWFDRPHRSIATLVPERTMVCSAASKTLNVCGWRVGWCVAPAELTDRLRDPHRFLTFCAPTPLQLGVAAALGRSRGNGYGDTLRADYRQRRDGLLTAFRAIGAGTAPVAGGTFVVADLTPLMPSPDTDPCVWLAETAGVTGLPLDAFYADPADARGLLRLAFCRDPAVLREAADRLLAAFPPTLTTSAPTTSAPTTSEVNP